MSIKRPTKPKAIKARANRARAAAEPQRKPPTGANIPDDIRAPGFGEVRGDSWVKPGRYVMQNGTIAVVEKPITVKFGIGMRQSWQGWKGRIEGTVGEGLTWGLDGKRSDATPAHEHDLKRRHKTQAKVKP